MATVLTLVVIVEIIVVVVAVPVSRAVAEQWQWWHIVGMNWTSLSNCRRNQTKWWIQHSFWLLINSNLTVAFCWRAFKTAINPVGQNTVPGSQHFSASAVEAWSSDSDVSMHFPDDNFDTLLHHSTLSQIQKMNLMHYLMWVRYVILEILSTYILNI